MQDKLDFMDHMLKGFKSMREILAARLEKLWDLEWGREG